MLRWYSYEDSCLSFVDKIAETVIENKDVLAPAVETTLVSRNNLISVLKTVSSINESRFSNHANK